MTAETIASEHPIEDEEPTPQDAEAWRAWIDACLRDTAKGYSAKPEWLKRDANGEKSIARDYANRELLELLQNAADAATEATGKGRVHIEITPEGLCVANTGATFRAGGVRSLMTEHASDKPDRKATLIGAKGLGFRALLNWSAEPFITSGALEIGFSRRHASDQVEALGNADARIRRLLDRSSKPLVPILAFPIAYPEPSAADDNGMAQLVARARTLRSEGYDTVVVAPFADRKFHVRAIEQLAEFHPDFLLFVEAVGQIVIHADGQPVRRWSKYEQGGKHYALEVATGDEISVQEWVCDRRRGSLPDPEAPSAERGYELAIAVRRGDFKTAGLLHCYFPTEVPVPFPALFHATLELDSNRKALNANSDVNAGVLDALAIFYADFLAELGGTDEGFEPIELLARKAPFPAPLQLFEEKVYAAAAARPLIPTNGGAYATASETRVEPIAFADYLPRRFFPKLAHGRTEAGRTVISRLKVGVLGATEMVATIEQASLTFDERARAIVGIARTLPPLLHKRSLLLDTDEKPLTQNNTSFPLPATGRPPALPRWARAKFLHPELWQKISAGLGGSARDRFDKLTTFGVSEFSAAGIIMSLRRQAADVIERGKSDQDKIRLELLQALFGLRQTVARESHYPVGLTEAVCADGQWRDVTKIHLSADYGGTGPIVSALYAANPERLLGSPQVNGLSAPAEDLADFFRWIGANKWPLGHSAPLPVALRPIAIDALPERFEVSDGIYRRVLDRSELQWGSSCSAETDWIAGLENILANAPSAAILAWLALDPRFDAMSPKIFATRLRAKSGNASYKLYRGPMPDMVRHLIGTSPWLAVAANGRAAPREAMVTPGPLSALFKAPLRPTSGDQAMFGLSRTAWQRGLIHAQVPDRLSDLGEDQIYRLLEDLEHRDPGPDVVRRLYAQLLLIDDFDPANAPEAARRFKTSGTVQVRKGGATGWSAVGEALYLDRDNFPAAAREHLAVLDLPPRRSAAEIAARFGVQPVSKQNFSLTVTRLVEDEGIVAATLRVRFHDSLPFIKAYRIANSVDTSRIRRLETLALKIAVDVELAFSLGNSLFDGHLEPGKHLLDGDSLLICINPAENEDVTIMRAMTALSDGLAEMFELQAGDDFEKLLLAGNDALRMLQLRRLLDNHTPEEIDKLIATLETELSEPDEPYGIDAAMLAQAIAPPPTPSNPTPPAAPAAGWPSPPTAPAPAAPSGATGAQEAPPAPPPAAPEPPPKATGVVATPLETVSSPEQGSGRGGWTVGVRIGGVTSGAQRNADIEAPGDAEQWAIFFEESQGRFPLSVARLQGQGAYGCDCLSFADAEQRDLFIADPQQNAKLIARFIEVKSGAVRLTQNELASAERHRERYFIYQILFDASARTAAHLTIVADPLRHPGALARECEVRVDQIQDRERIRLSAVAKS